MDAATSSGTAKPVELCIAFVGNLACNVTQAHLQELFEPFGNLKSVYVRIPDPDASRTFGFVRFTSPESRDAAVAALNGSELLGFPMNVQRSHQEPRQPGSLRESRSDGFGGRRCAASTDGAAVASRYSNLALASSSCSSVSQRHDLDRIKELYFKILAEQGVGCDAAETKVADFIEHLSRIPYSLIDVSGMDEQATAIQSQSSMSQQRASYSRERPAADSAQYTPKSPPAGTALTCASIMQQSATLTSATEASRSTSFPQNPRTSLQPQQQTSAPSRFQPFAAAPKDRLPPGVDLSCYLLAGSDETSGKAASLPQLCSAVASLGVAEGRGRGRAILEFLSQSGDNERRPGKM